MKRIFSALCAIFFVANALAYGSGNRLLSDMNSSDGSAKRAALNYVAGVVEGYSFAEDIHKSGKYVCIQSAEVTHGQLAAIVKKGLEDKPESRHEQARFLIVLYIAEAFPCPKKSP
jgi:hypothetical protein